MTMPNLLVEIGNTALKAAWSEGITLGKTFRYQGEKMFEYVDSLVEKEKPAVMVISSTIEIGIKEEENLRSKCGILVILDGLHTDIACEYDLPAYLSPDRVASVMMTLPRPMVQVTISWGMTLGIRCLKIRRDTLRPQASAAVMYSCSRRDRIWPRTRRAIPAQPRKPRISIK